MSVAVVLSIRFGKTGFLGCPIHTRILPDLALHLEGDELSSAAPCFACFFRTFPSVFCLLP